MLKLQTRNNNHTGAMITLAKYYGLKKYVKIFTAIYDIYEVEGHKAIHLYDYHYSVYKELMLFIQTNYPQDYEDVHGAL
jgi:hypothetical protein